MKKIIYLFFLSFSLFTGCNDDKFLRENADDFLTVDNSYLNAAQFRTGLNEFYRIVRQNYNFQDNPVYFFYYGAGTDVFFRPNSDQEPFTDWSYINSTTDIFRIIYGRHYGMLQNVNQLLKQTENPEVRWNSEEEKLAIQAEARFFRGYCYRFLGCMFGGVPVLKEPVETPSLAFTRNSREEVYQLCVEDFEFAGEHLPVSVIEPGRVVKAAAYHYLSEMYIALADEKGGDKELYKKAVDAASMVIDQKVGEYHLMTERHGYRKDVAGKDAFWDLFQMRSVDGFSNFSYQTGNKESIWVIQVDKFITGGLNDGLSTRTDQERVFWPAFWGSTKFGYDGVARDWMGRGIGWLRPTNYFNYDLWEKSGEEDQRNSEANINRIFRSPDPIIDGVEVANYDTTYVTEVTLADGTPYTAKTRPGDIIKKEWLTSRQDTMERIYPRIMKLGSDWHYAAEPANGFVMEFYAIRMAETYLLRAEAYMKYGDKDNAAKDINVVRSRAKAVPATASEINIDYILDERARELVGEEFRTMTLCRLGLLYDRTKRFGYYASQNTVNEKNNLCPIPQSVIDANSQAKFPNNPGF
ncbi:RagB/SusD family nutrient uptake outer membrane protein [Parabacteroides pacaensis]|uniref:RagB/SusD family nutrient uptake outer membrane protein n=1 Tax=Parabacteroides pacaensis TaxID=2086575 RepID=UPI000D1118B5|nr:RagB/SusD family nutrient uptake outer membrane protein [Parabacteroides pacaensis]